MNQKTGRTSIEIHHHARRARFWLAAVLFLFLTFGACESLAGAQASSPASQKQVALMSPQIVVSIDANGVKRFSMGGAPFVPIGVNYFLEGQGTYNGHSYKTFNMFDTQSFNFAAIDSAMASIASKGFNYVRLWLKGADTDNGFSRPNAWNLYVGNIVATIHSAEKHGLHVVLTGSFPGPTGKGFVPANYLPTDKPANVTSSNVLLLVPAVTRALGSFYKDLLTVMQTMDPNIANAIFYIDLYNELKYDVTALPLSQTSGSFTFNSKTYSLNDYSTNDLTHPASRQALMDAATEQFIREAGSGVKSAMPHVMVTASNLYNYAFGHGGFDGGVAKPTKYYATRPYSQLQGGAEIIDIHNYPSATFTSHADAAMASDEFVTIGATRKGTQVSARNAPLLSGEFGSYTAMYVTSGATYVQGLQNGISMMRTVEGSTFCPYGYSGFAVWDWDSLNSGTFVMVDPAHDPGSLYLRALAPVYNTRYCGETIKP